MNRKTIKTRTGAYHVTLPIRLVEEFDETLAFKESRSAKIARLMQVYVQNEGGTLYDYSVLEIMEYLQYQFDKDSPEDVLCQALLALC